MVRPISNDLHKRAVAAVAKRQSCRSVALRFGVAVSSVVKWSQRYRVTGSVAPGKMGGTDPVVQLSNSHLVDGFAFLNVNGAGELIAERSPPFCDAFVPILVVGFVNPFAVCAFATNSAFTASRASPPRAAIA
ncbi:hypothetical protein ABIB82_005353 [Bradyrhizobium sp. i1.8.4]